MIRRLLVIALVIAVVACLAGPTLASEAKGEGAQGAEGAEGAEAEGVPPLYYVQWLALLAAFVLGLLYVVKVYRKGKPHHEGLILACMLTILAATYFGITYVEAVKEHHEAPLLTLLRFVLLVLAGASITFYGVLGRHDEH